MSNSFYAPVIHPLLEGEAFHCVRGCFECRAYKEESVDLPIEENFDFYRDVKDFFLKNRIRHQYLSCNHFGDFVEDFDQCKLGIDILKKANLLKPDKYQGIELFANMGNLTPEIDRKIKGFLRDWDFSIELRFCMSLYLEKDFDSILSTIKNIHSFFKTDSGIFRDINLMLQLELHNVHKNRLTEKEKQTIYLLLCKIKTEIPAIHMRIPWELGKNNFRLFQKDYNLAFTTKPVEYCPFSRNSKIYVDEDNLYLNEMDIYKNAIRPHGKYCHYLNNFSIGTIYTDFATLKKNARLLKSALLKVTSVYQEQSRNENICEFCIKNFQKFTPFT